jgi:hypothetical protein
MRAVGPDYQVGARRRAVGQRGPDGTIGLVQFRDPGAEPVVGVGGGGLVQHVGQVAAQDLELADQAVPVECVDGHLGATGPVRLHPRDPTLFQGAVAQLIQ